MKVLIIGYEDDIDKAIKFLSDKYVYSETDIIETCIWNDANTVKTLIYDNPVKYDYYVLSFRFSGEANSIGEALVSSFNIPADRIINFNRCYETTIPLITVDRMMSDSNRVYDGIILGISHSEVGIIPELLEGSFVNLAVSSQDLFYNLKTLEYCMTQYPEKIRNVKRLIIDMFDYTYFNYDVSMSNTIFTYVHGGGFQGDEHNYQQNKNKKVDFKSTLNYINNLYFEDVSLDMIKVWCDLFDNVHNKDGYKGYGVTDRITYRNKIVSDEDVEEYKVEVPIVAKCFDATIAENIELFNKILEKAKDLNSDIEITCILIPRYAEAQEKSKEAYLPWKKEFYDIISEAKKRYDFDFIDFKNDDIAKHREYYYDVGHLNYAGAIAFSSMLNDRLYGKKN